MSKPQQHRTQPFWPFLAALLVIVGVVFLPACRNDFVSWDDGILVYGNEDPKYSPLTSAVLADIWREPHRKLYIPVTYTAWAFLWQAGKLDTPRVVDEELSFNVSPAPFHAANVALHLANTLLVFGILLSLVKERWPALLGALVFGLHPLQAETVCWISELKGVLSGFFCLAAIALYLRAGQGGRGRLLIFAALVSAVVAFLAKPAALALPFILIGCEVALRTPWRTAARRLAPFLALAIVGALAARWAQPPNDDTPITALWQRPFIAADALNFYAAKFLLPVNLCLDYGRTTDRVLAKGWIYFSPLPLLAALFITWKLGRKQHDNFPLGALAIFVAALLPVLGFVPFIYQAFSTVADRYAYLALLGPALLVAWLLARWTKPTAYVVCGVVLFVWAGQTMRQSEVWANDETLFRRGIEVNPQSFTALGGYADFIMRNGDYERALGYFRLSIEQRPRDYLRRFSIGDLLMKLERPAEAAQEFKICVESKPTSAMAHYNLGNALGESKQLNAAIASYRNALRLNPKMAEAQNNLAITLAKKGNLKEAIPLWQASLRNENNNPSAHFNLGNALMKTGNRVGAIREFQELLRQAPEFEPARRALEKAQK